MLFISMRGVCDLLPPTTTPLISNGKFTCAGLGGAISEKEVWRERVKMKQIDSILSNNTPQKDREVRILSVINF